MPAYQDYGIYYSKDDERIETIWASSAEEAFEIFRMSNTSIEEDWYAESIKSHIKMFEV